MRFVKGILFAITRVFVSLWTGIKFLFQTIWFFTVKYCQIVIEYTAPPRGEGKRPWSKHLIVRWPIRGFLLLFVPFVFLVVPAGLIVTVTAVLVAIDQTLYQPFEVDQRFVNIAVEVNGNRPELKDIGATIFAASYLQMQRELDSFLGWLPNDVIGFQFLDNRVNRQLGVLHASRELLEVTAISISKLGSTDEEDRRLVNARQEGFAFEPTSWILPASENRYYAGIKLVQEYQADLRAGRIQNATINITNTDIETILLAVADRVLEVPHGRLNARSFNVAWNEIDDRVFFAQGAAIVARDALVALRYAFEKKIADAGALENMNQAIASLEGAVRFHPWWVMRGEGDSQWADHRSKMSRYYTDARKRIIDVANAINR